MSETPKSLEGTPEQTPVQWMMAQTREGLYKVLVGAGNLVVTTVGGAVRVVGGAVGGALEGTARGIRDAVSGNQKQGPEAAPQSA